jgi:hypothetical protein
VRNVAAKTVASTLERGRPGGLVWTMGTR